jgi:hypothetical protein
MVMQQGEQLQFALEATYLDDPQPHSLAAYRPINELQEMLFRYGLDAGFLRCLVTRGEDVRQWLRLHEVPSELVSVMTFLYHLLMPPGGATISTPADIAALLMLEMGHLDHEEFRVICLDTKHRVQKMYTLYVGTLNTSILRIVEVYREAIRLNSAAVILVHNHPSGDPNASMDDIDLTRQIVEAGKLLEVECLDHLIIGHGRWVSMRERKLGWS